MTIFTADGRLYVDVGTYDIWNALRSTVIARLRESDRLLQPAIGFLRSGKCEAQNGLVTARSMNYVRDALSKVGPNKMVYDLSDPKKAAPWGDNISPVITSCANYFTTADGKDLLAELVGILTYAYYAKSDVTAE